MDATSAKISGNSRKDCFELFGYDFMVDSDFKCWLIEVNSNPCLEDWSCPLLKELLPRVLESMFSIAIDPFAKRISGKTADSKASINMQSSVVEKTSGGDEEKCVKSFAGYGADTSTCGKM